MGKKVMKWRRYPTTTASPQNTYLSHASKKYKSNLPHKYLFKISLYKSFYQLKRLRAHKRLTLKVPRDYFGCKDSLNAGQGLRCIMLSTRHFIISVPLPYVLENSTININGGIESRRATCEESCTPSSLRQKEVTKRNLCGCFRDSWTTYNKKSKSRTKAPL